MPLRKFFHLIHVVDDFDAIAARYDAVFSPHLSMPKSWSDFDKRWASLAVWGPDFVLEVMEPSKDPTDAQAPVPRFHARHGGHLHSFSWLVDKSDFRAFVGRLEHAGVRVLEPYPVAKDARPGRTMTCFTHPKDTFGLIEFQSWDGPSRYTPHTAPDWDSAYWRDEHPLGLLRMSHLTTVVEDVEEARIFYEEVFDATTFHEEVGSDRLSAFALVGDDTIVEFAQPTDAGSVLGRDLAQHGQIPHAMTFLVKDLEASARHVESTGIPYTVEGATLTLDSATMGGAIVALTTRRLPGDPRE